MHIKKLTTKIILNKVCFSIQFVRAITNNNINILELPPEHDSIILTLWSCGLQHCAIVPRIGKWVGSSNILEKHTVSTFRVRKTQKMKTILQNAGTDLPDYMLS